MKVAAANRHDELRRQLEALHLDAFALNFAELALRAAKEGLSHEAYLYELVKLQRERREQRRVQRLLREAGLPQEKTFRTLSLAAFPAPLRLQLERLKSGAFRKRVAIGKPGVGKSHALCAVAYELAHQGHPVLWTATSALVGRVLAAKRDLRLPQELAKLDRFACVLLDDIGSVQQDREEMEVLFTFLAERYERRSVGITTNLVFSDWQRIFKDPLTTVAALDRVIHHSVILDMRELESYRARTAQLRLQGEGGELTE
jgi:DNA replication protein DnaC